MTDPPDLQEYSNPVGNKFGFNVKTYRLSHKSSVSVSCAMRAEMSRTHGDSTRVRWIGGCREATHPCLPHGVTPSWPIRICPSALRNTGLHITSLPAQNVCLDSEFELHSLLEMRCKDDDRREASDSGAPHGLGETKRIMRRTTARCTSSVGMDSFEGVSSNVEGGEGLLNAVRYRVAESRPVDIISAN
jgi:hypothetical protein